jgi:hypothetical protein
MSEQILDRIKQQTGALTVQEKAQLVAFLTDQLNEDEEAQATDGNQAEDQSDILRQKRMAWLKNHRAEYGGQYVALDDDQLVGVGRTYREARDAAHAVGKPNVFVTYLSKPDEIAEWGGWG